ncbi:WD40 repeat domain-containing protein [Polyangium sp. y55x31]|uniref:WD40 repeat domain-containing protein n=1 Tax=Polyangium sp. y55x31 TaxID=3042688 RepID=UPI0024824528|nr:WD40 repeat domain-containing protein [Polyangium sp. y55x31]MDI1484538.1 WD40 repeat domain-containing protein [Polyangium sp. y55x31]
MPEVFPLPTLITRMEGQIEHILPCGDVVLVHTNGRRHSVTVHERKSGRLLRELVSVSPIGPFDRQIALAPDGRSVFCTFFDDRIVQIDIESGETLRSAPFPTDGALVRSGDWLAVSPRGDVVYVAVWGDIFTWDLGTNELGQTPFRALLGTNGMACAPDGGTVWVNSNELNRFELGTAAGTDIRHDREGAQGLVLLAAADCVAVGSFDGIVEFWSTSAPPRRTATTRIGPEPHHRVCMTSLRGGTLLAASSVDQRVNILAPSDPHPRKRLGGIFSEIECLGSDDADSLWVGDTHGGLWRYDLAEEPLGAPPPSPKGKTKAPKFPMTNHFWPGPAETSMVRTAPGRTFSVGGFRGSPPLDRDLCAWEREREDATAHRWFARRKIGYELAVVAGRFVVLDDGGSNLLAVDGATLATVAKLHHKGVQGTAANRAGDRLITTGGTEIKVWSTETWEVVASRQNPEVPQRALQWLDDGRVLFLDKNDAFGFLSADDLKRQATRKLAHVQSVVSDPAGAFVACATGTQVHVWNVASGEIVALPAGTSSPVFLDGGLLGVVERHGAWVASFRMDGTLVRRVELGPTALRGQRSTEARMWGQGSRVAVVCQDVVFIASARAELDVLDMRTGETVASRIVVQGIGSLVFDGADIAYLTGGGRAEWLASRDAPP